MQIVEKLKQLVANERKLTAEIIEHIQKIEALKIHLQMGFPTLFSFLTEHIGYSPASAQRRIDASRLLTSVPEVSDDIKLGRINLSQVSMVAQAVRQKQKEEPGLQINATDKKIMLEKIIGQTYEASQKIISQSLNLQIKQHDHKKIQQDESVRFEITFSKVQMELLNRVKSLLSHTNPNASVAETFEHLANFYLKQKCPTRKIKNTNIKKITLSKINNANHRVSHSETTTRKPIPMPLKRYIWNRDHGCCQFKDTNTGKICGTKHLLEIDHIKRVRHGGNNHPSNLRLLCNAHNLLRN
jgi:hypothetical protein